MLPRVSNALSKFISPLTTTKKATDSFQKFVAPKKEDPSKGKKKERTLKLVPKAQEKADASLPMVALQDTMRQHGVVMTFLHLIETVKTKRSKLLRWLGEKTYKTFVRQQKKSSFFKKGALFDKKIE